MAEYVSVRDGDTEWQPVFERDQISQVLLPVGSELAKDIADSGWVSSYQDDEFVVLRP
jgi:hypothetical protein